MSFKARVLESAQKWGFVSGALQRIWFLRHRSARTSFAIDQPMRDIVDIGYSIIPEYRSRRYCEDCRHEIDRILLQFPQGVQVIRGEGIYGVGEPGADMRFFGAQHVSDPIREFANDHALIALADRYCGYSNVLFATLAARLRPSPGERYGSGGGWHRDGFVPEIKGILYLTDVCAENGPFQIIARSHHRHMILRDMRSGCLRYNQNRINEKGNAIIDRDPERRRVITGEAGTLILFDTSAIHTGAPIVSGERYALTNYILNKTSINDALYRHYAPIMKAPGTFTLRESQIS